MLEKPSLPDEHICTCLHTDYRLAISQVTFLPLGADRNTAVYRVTTQDKREYFLKLRSGPFDEASVTIPQFLSHLGLQQIIPALPTVKRQLWTNLDACTVILYPFVSGKNGFQVNLSDAQRIEFGAALKKFHTADIPPTLTHTIRREQFSPQWRDTVKAFLAQIEVETFVEPVAAETAVFLKAKHADTMALVSRAAKLARQLQAAPPDFILCHGDIHGWNLLIDTDNNLYLVDWDTLIFAPKERDLMFVGSGLGGHGHTLAEEEALFYQGYGQTEINPIALAYYHYERIIEDIAVFCQQLFLSDEGGEDRAQALQFLQSNFRPGGTIETAYQLDKTELAV